MAGLVDAMVRRQAQAPRPAGGSLSRASQPGGDGRSFLERSWQTVRNLPTVTRMGVGFALNDARNDLGRAGASYFGGVARANNPPNPFGDYSSRLQGTTRTISNQNDIDQQIGALRSSLNTSLMNLGSSRLTAINNQNARNQAFNNSEAAYRQQLASQLAEAGLDIRANDIQLGNFGDWYNLLEQKKWNRVAQHSANLAYNAQQQVNSANQRLIDWREIQQGRKEVGQQAQRAIRDATSAATVSGVIQGAKQDFADIDQERGNALYGLDLADQKSRLSERERRQQISNNRKNLMADFNAFAIDADETGKKLREREQLLQIEAQRARLKPQQLMDAMNVTLANLGLDRAISTGQFLEALNNMDAQTRTLFTDYINGVGQAQRTRTTTPVQIPNIPLLNPPARAGTGRRQTYDRQGFR